MNTFPSNIVSVLSRYAAGEELSLAEQSELEDWAAASALNAELMTSLKDPAFIRKGLQDRVVANNLRSSDWERVAAHLALPSYATEPSKLRYMRSWRWAAAVILLLGAVGTYLFIFKQKDETSLATNANMEVDIPPGSNKAVLTLSNGTSILLDSMANGAIAQQGNARIIKEANGEIRYTLTGAPPVENLMNTMRTPKGGQYQLLLPDGTKVWLNASSSITYPAVFTGKERRVSVSGEVYMEVAQNHQVPFKVSTSHVSVVVLGTSFNINAYADDAQEKVTLISGAVKILSNEQQVVLKPGQQAVVAIAGAGTSKTSGIQLNSSEDVEQTLAWKNGLFSFNKTPLESVLRQLERWYDIKVSYEVAVPNIVLSGEMYRNVALSNVLNFMKESGVKFRMEGKELIIL